MQDYGCSSVFGFWVYLGAPLVGGGEGCATLWPFVGGQSPGAHTLQGGTWWAADQALCPSLRRSLSVSPHLSVESVNQTKAAQGKVRVHNSRSGQPAASTARPRAWATWSFIPWKEHHPVMQKLWLPLSWDPFCAVKWKTPHSTR